jgi:hypothetical protein
MVDEARGGGASGTKGDTQNQPTATLPGPNERPNENLYYFIVHFGSKIFILLNEGCYNMANQPETFKNTSEH